MASSSSRRRILIRPTRLQRLAGFFLFSTALTAPLALAQSAQPFSLDQVLGYPQVTGVVASPRGDRVAWVEDVRGVRNIWEATSPAFVARQLTLYTEDDGQDLTQLAYTADDSRLVYVRGGDEDENWPAKDHLAPDPAGSPTQPQVTIWSIPLRGAPAAPVEVAEGDAPALSMQGRLAYVKDGAIWVAPVNGQADGHGKPERLFFDRGEDRSPVWSPDGLSLAFVSGREGHSFIGIYTAPSKPLVYLAPSTNRDSIPVWSPDGGDIAFVREPGQGSVPESFLTQTPHPFAIWTANATTGAGHAVWSAPDTRAGALPDLARDEPLFWMADDRLVFLAETDNWPHLYAVPVQGGSATLLTPGSFMVEDVVPSLDRRSLVYSANTGDAAADAQRRHLFRVAMEGGAPQGLTGGQGLEWSPAALRGGAVAYVSAGATRPAAMAMLGGASHTPRMVHTDEAEAFPAAALLTPQPVTFKAADGLTVHGLLFRRESSGGAQPGVIFVHGGPTRQMLLGWHPLGYYSNAYAVDQYLAAHGFTVLSVDYRGGTGYGRAYQHPPHEGSAGAAEYQDVLAGAHYLQQVHGVDAKRIGIWGGSYGGYLTGLALARNSDIFKAGVDIHGIYNWIPELAKEGALPEHWYEAQGDWPQAIQTAIGSSPLADIEHWRSPVLLIQGDDDRNVQFEQTVTLADALQRRHVPFQELVLPNEIHMFLRYQDWRAADEATVRFFTRELAPAQ
jgi:dipeptidyl aminopeptidase/acylaminoacyl peptidase